MPKRASKIAESLKQLGDIQVTDWDFMELLNTEIKDLEISRSLKRLGAIQVMEWDFRTVIPAVKKVANQELDVIDLFKRTAHYKVMDWDFRSALHTGTKAAPQEPAGGPSQEEVQAVTTKLRNFLEYVAVNLIDEPGHAQIKVSPLGPNGLRFKLVLVKKDVAMLIGREGFTAAAIRSILKAAAGKYGFQALLQIHSHEEEAAFISREEARR
jgi:predicted RNA-binding protein YlqC (UPF0109 family)